MGPPDLNNKTDPVIDMELESDEFAKEMAMIADDDIVID
jgi:hypothetical protein